MTKPLWQEVQKPVLALLSAKVTTLSLSLASQLIKPI